MTINRMCRNFRKASSAIGRGGMVATSRKEAAEIGITVLKEGGNAFDAAVAISFALAVCEPSCSGLGGGGFMTAYDAEKQKTVFVDFREVAPGFAVPSIWKTDETGNVINNEKSIGPKSVCVPGELAGMCHILRKYGTKSLKDVISPAIKLAEEGYEVTKLMYEDLMSRRADMLLFEEKGNPYLASEWKIGDRIKNPDLADSFRLIAEKGEDAFYRGEITDKLIRSLNHFGASFTREDFDQYRVNEYTPIEGTYRGYRVLSSPLPSSGGTHVIEILNMLENFPISEYGFDSPERLNVIAEVFKKCYSDRLRYMGDPKFVKVPIKGLADKAYAADRAEEIKLYTLDHVYPGEPFEYESPDTTHISVVDQWGNMVALTQTISAFFGSAMVPEGTGIVLNCQMRCFRVGEGFTNSVAPYKKPLSSMSPTIVLKGNQPFAVLGSPGGNCIISAVTQTISNMIDFSMPIDEADFAGRIFIDSETDLKHESRFDPSTIEKLKEIGYNCIPIQPLARFMGGVNAIQIQEGGLLMGVADPRRNGVAIPCEYEINQKEKADLINMKKEKKHEKSTGISDGNAHGTEPCSMRRRNRSYKAFLWNGNPRKKGQGYLDSHTCF